PSENPIASKPEFPGRKSSRKPLPAELPRETHRLLPAETSCPACGGVRCTGNSGHYHLFFF
ncbi:hypothetical protein E3X71_22830, partial [Shigella flexneri]|nr:hypothetical protein [Shigella flexneri]